MWALTFPESLLLNVPQSTATSSDIDGDVYMSNADIKHSYPCIFCVHRQTARVCEDKLTHTPIPVLDSLATVVNKGNGKLRAHRTYLSSLSA